MAPDMAIIFLEIGADADNEWETRKGRKSLIYKHGPSMFIDYWSKNKEWQQGGWGRVMNGVKIWHFYWGHKNRSVMLCYVSRFSMSLFFLVTPPLLFCTLLFVCVSSCILFPAFCKIFQHFYWSALACVFSPVHRHPVLLNACLVLFSLLLFFCLLFLLLLCLTTLPLVVFFLHL